MSRKEFLTLIAFVLFILGFTSLALSMVGIRWSFLAWIDKIGPVFGIVTKISMILIGIVMLYLSQSSDFDSEE